MKAIIYYDEEFDPHKGKFLEGLVRHKRENIIGILSKNPKGSLVSFSEQESLPIFKSVDNLPSETDSLIIGKLHFKGNKCPKYLIDLINVVTSRGIKIYNGTHAFIRDYIKNKKLVIDLRRIKKVGSLFSGKLLNKNNQLRILTVGMDANIGKMTTAIKLKKELTDLRLDVEFVATGQIGMVIEGKGIPLDRTIVDFTSGEMEEYLSKFNNKILIIEGQGSLFTPLYSGLTVAQMHGSVPHMLILCSDPFRKYPRYIPQLSLPHIKKAISQYEDIAQIVNKNSKVIAVSVNTNNLNKEEALNYIKILEKELNLPVTDPVRFGCKKIIERIIK